MKSYKILYVMSIFLMILTTSCGISGSGPGKSAKDFALIISDAQIITAFTNLAGYQGYTDEKRTEATYTLSLLSMYCSDHGGINKIDIVNEQIDSDSANITLGITFNDDSYEEWIVRLVMEEGEWKVDL